MRTRALAFVALLPAIGCPILAPSAVRAEPIQSYDTYGAWLLACDNTLTCLAKGFEDGGSRAELTITRGAGPNGALSARLAAETRFDREDIATDGVALSLTADGWDSRSDEYGTVLQTEDAAAVRALVDVLRDGKTLTLGSRAQVPLAGLTAALLRADERQGRIGTVTALIRAGAIEAARVSPAPPLPKVPERPIEATMTQDEGATLAADIRRRQRKIFDTEGCVDDLPSSEPTAYALDDTRALVFYPCWMGAYQGSSVAFVAMRDGASAERLVLPLPYLGNDSDRADAEFFTEGDFDPATGTLFMAAKGRGLADCGMSAAWIWNGSGFELSELSLQEACGGLEPGDWPTLFRSEP